MDKITKVTTSSRLREDGYEVSSDRCYECGGEVVELWGEGAYTFRCSDNPPNNYNLDGSVGYHNYGGYYKSSPR